MSAPDSADPYVGLDTVLETLGAAMGAAECHGSLCGYMVGSTRGAVETLTARDAQSWVAGVIDQAGVVPGQLLEPAGVATGSDVAAGAARLADCVAGLEGTWQDTLSALGSEDYEFTPLLPVDPAPIGLRTRSLGRWCAGFLSGLGAGGTLDADALAPSVAEVIRDFAEIARIEPSPDDDEASESALTELTEYVKVGVLLVQAVLRGDGGDVRHPAPARTLH